MPTPSRMNKVRDLIGGQSSPRRSMGTRDVSDSRASSGSNRRKGMAGKESGPSSVKEHEMLKSLMTSQRKMSVKDA